MSAHRRNVESSHIPMHPAPSSSRSQAGKAELGKHPGLPSRLQTSSPASPCRAPQAAPRDQRMLSPPCWVLGQGLCWTGWVPHAAQGQGGPAHGTGRPPHLLSPTFGCAAPRGSLIL